MLKPGGGFSVSDIVLEGNFPEELKKAAELYVGCVSGALPKAEYPGALRDIGFQGIEVVREKAITLPEDLLSAYLSGAERESLKKSGVRILSVTVRGTKPADSGSAPE